MTPEQKKKHEIETHKKNVALRDALVKLENNRDFKKVFINFYQKEFVETLVMQRAMPEIRLQEGRIDINTSKLDAVGEFAHFIRTLKAMGADSEYKLAEMQRMESEPDFEDEDEFEDEV